MNNKELVYKIASFIPKSKVLTYTALAKLANIKSPRLVGNFLHKNKDPKNIPCHRVVNSKGEVAANYAFGGAPAQTKRFRNEGIVAVKNRVDLDEYLWQPSRCMILYFDLLRQYGEPGPWPWWGKGEPHKSEEIAIGAILTQNTAWRNVEYALSNLKEEKANTIAGVYHMGKKDLKVLKKLIRPSGFYNQKGGRLFNFCKFIIEDYKSLGHFIKLPVEEAREKLLALKGIGEETADTILLYAGNKPIFVVDAYTKRFVKDHNLCKETDYDFLQKFFTENLPVNTKLYKDYHALMVQWGKKTRLLQEW
jgi:endonuclease-3 related protein